jgi:hypothetical protein
MTSKPIDLSAMTTIPNTEQMSIPFLKIVQEIFGLRRMQELRLDIGLE